MGWGRQHQSWKPVLDLAILKRGLAPARPSTNRKSSVDLCLFGPQFQGVLTRLYNALEVTPKDDYNSVLGLPSLQFGEFQLHNKPSIQVKVLIELLSSMLLRIEETLGISQASASSR